jgi:hypothetical protein
LVGQDGPVVVHRCEPLTPWKPRHASYTKFLTVPSVDKRGGSLAVHQLSVSLIYVRRSPFGSGAPSRTPDKLRMVVSAVACDHQMMMGVWRLLIRRSDRYADRRAPNPTKAALTGGLLVALYACLAVIEVMQTRLVGPSWEQWVVGSIFGVLLLLHLFLQVHNYRYAVWRAGGIFGPTWRQLTKPDRDAHWQQYCQQWGNYFHWNLSDRGALPPS